MAIVFHTGYYKINNEECSKYACGDQCQLRRIECNRDPYKNIRGNKYQWQQGIETHFINTGSIQVFRSFSQNENGGGRTCHADGIEKNGKAKYLVKCFCKK